MRRLFLISLAAALLPAIAYAAVSEHAAKHPPLPPAVQALAAHPGTRAHVIAGLKTLRETGVIAWARYEPAGKPAVAIGRAGARPTWTLTAGRGIVVGLPDRATTWIIPVAWLRLLALLGAAMAVAGWAAVAVLKAAGEAAAVRRRLGSLRPRPAPAKPRVEAADDRRLDPLTGLYDRQGMREEAESAIIRRRGEGEMSLLLLDLDEFKEINDTLGHSAGDQLLRGLSDRLRTAVPVDAVLSRLGGDEFAILVPGADGPAAMQLASELCENLRRPFHVADTTLEVDVSIGVAVWPRHALDYQTLLQRADIAMYQAKRDGRGGYSLSSDEQQRRHIQRLALAADLRRAIGAGELELHYQPKVELEKHSVCGLEALVRWRHPGEGMIPPERFIPLAERSGLIRRLSEWVVDAALEQAADCKRDGRELPISVNLSTRDLIDLALPAKLERALTRAGVTGRVLDVEITESVLMADPNRARAVITRIGELEASTTIDDFGVGFSSLAYLKRLPVQALKIDGSFVRGMTQDPRDAMIVQSVIDLAHNLDLQVVAEGAEDELTLARLRQAGCDQVQGYVYSPPLPIAQLRYWLDDHERSAA
ncbi:MAG TPA: EAL domain-containing protein [Thermoleophilia bacterium]|nr:EAL domain-containing protein [Thermoleophilia bacterium]